MEIALILLDPEVTLRAPRESTSWDGVSVIYGLFPEGKKTRTYIKMDYEEIATLKKASKERVLKTKVATMTEKNLANKSPHRIGGRFHPLINIPADHYKPCQYCMYKERKVNKEAAKNRHCVKKRGKLRYDTKSYKQVYSTGMRYVKYNINLCSVCCNESINFRWIGIGIVNM